MGHTLAEKILLAHADADDLSPGDFAMVRCDVVMASDAAHTAAIDQAKIAYAKADDPRVKQLAQRFGTEFVGPPLGV